MLDQNTDRMWFVIGAVIVGAAIVFIANGMLPDVFASIADTFENSSEESTEIIDNIRPYLITDGVNHGNITPWAVLYWADGKVHRHGQDGDYYWADGDVVLDAERVVPGERYLLSIEGININDSKYRNIIRGPFYYNASGRYLAAEFSADNSEPYGNGIVFDIPLEIVRNGDRGYTNFQGVTGDIVPHQIRFSFDKIIHVLSDLGIEESDIEIRLEKVT